MIGLLLTGNGWMDDVPLFLRSLRCQVQCLGLENLLQERGDLIFEALQVPFPSISNYRCQIMQQSPARGLPMAMKGDNTWPLTSENWSRPKSLGGLAILKTFFGITHVSSVSSLLTARLVA